MSTSKEQRSVPGFSYEMFESHFFPPARAEVSIKGQHHCMEITGTSGDGDKCILASVELMAIIFHFFPVKRHTALLYPGENQVLVRRLNAYSGFSLAGLHHSAHENT